MDFCRRPGGDLTEQLLLFVRPQVWLGGALHLFVSASYISIHMTAWYYFQCLYGGDTLIAKMVVFNILHTHTTQSPQCTPNNDFPVTHKCCLSVLIWGFVSEWCQQLLNKKICNNCFTGAWLNLGAPFNSQQMIYCVKCLVCPGMCQVL